MFSLRDVQDEVETSISSLKIAEVVLKFKWDKLRMELWTVLEAWNRGTYHVFRNREDNPQKSILYSCEEQRKALDFFLNENVSS